MKKILFVLFAGLFLSQSYGYGRNESRIATVVSAQEILADTGGIFISMEYVRSTFNVFGAINIPYRLPFTEQDILECGRCVLFPTISRVGRRNTESNILSFLREPTAKRLFIRTQSRRNAWFKNEPFARKNLSTKWHLVRLGLAGKGIPLQRQYLYGGYERLLSANVAFFMLMLLPPSEFDGEYFFTGDIAQGRSSNVIVGRPVRGSININFVQKRIGRSDTGIITEIIPRRMRRRR